MTQEKPTVGRIVHFVDADGLHRPAIVVCVEDADAMLGLQVFRPGMPTFSGGWEAAVKHDESGTLKTWHWPERG